MTESQVEAMVIGNGIRWVGVAACAAMACHGNPAIARKAIVTTHNFPNSLGKHQLPEVGFAKPARCEQSGDLMNAALSGGLGSLGGFDLTKLGGQMETPRFGRPACAVPVGSNHRGDLRVSNLTDGDSAAPSQQRAMPESSPGNLQPKLATAKDAYAGTFALTGLAIGSIPTYEGSSHSRIVPVPGALGRIGGVDFRIAGPSLTLDFIKGRPDAKVGLAFGPSIRYRFNRNGKTGDAVVDQLGKLKGVIEFGVNAGVTVKRVLTKYDLLSVGVSARWDISGRGSGLMVSPSVSYLMPVSKAQVVGALVSADFADTRYARYNYSVTPSGSAASGLPVYTAKGGLKAATLGAFTARDLNGNILDGGFAVGVGAMYSRLYGSAAKTPITALRGKSSQWILGGGLTYTF